MKRVLSIILVFIFIFQQPALAAKARSAKRTQQAQQAQQAQQKQQTAVAQTFPVPINKLANYKSLKKKMTDAEFKQAYDIALEIVKPIVHLGKEEQIRGITCYLRNMVHEGTPLPNLITMILMGISLRE